MVSTETWMRSFLQESWKQSLDSYLEGLVDRFLNLWKASLLYSVHTDFFQELGMSKTTTKKDWRNWRRLLRGSFLAPVLFSGIWKRSAPWTRRDQKAVGIWNLKKQERSFRLKITEIRKQETQEEQHSQGCLCTKWVGRTLNQNKNKCET